jgi:NADPH:quinone reductase-like Zn-dependent oxidoreductase
MKAAIVRGPGQTPVYGDFAEPVPSSGENRITVTAAAISHVVKSRASGTHYSFSGEFPFVVGIDGVGVSRFRFPKLKDSGQDGPS